MLEKLWETDPISLIHPDTLEHFLLLQEVASSSSNFKDSSWLLTDRAKEIRDLLTGSLVQVFPEATNVFRFPVLSEEACTLTGRLSEVYKAKPNKEEDPSYRINEILLKDESQLLDDLYTGVYAAVVMPILFVFSGVYSPVLNSIQLGNYNSDGTSSSNVSFHTDEDSDHSLVIELDGSTKGRGAGFTIFPDVELGVGKTGYATAFSGRSTMHRSLPINSGTRQILVYWTSPVLNLDLVNWKKPNKTEEEQLELDLGNT